MSVFVEEGKLSGLRGKEVFLPDGRKLGLVHDTVIEVDEWVCTHLFVVECPDTLVEGSVHLAVPWRWIRAISDIVILRWFPETPIPKEP